MRRLFIIWKVLWFCLAGVAVLPSFAVAQPVITTFESVAAVQTDGVLHVTETITATVPGNGHGLFRDIPYAVKLPSGQILRVPPTIQNVMLDGKVLPVTDTEERPDDRLRIFMRDTTQPLAAGQHVFTLSYTLSHMVGYFETYDELNWNVTGDLWAVPIEKATYTLTLPKGARIDKTAAWLGVRGSKEADKVDTRRRTVDGSPGVQFTTLRPLGPGEGLTCAVSFDKGVVEEPVVPPAEEKAIPALRPDTASAVALAFGMLVWGYFALAWWKVGRDPARGVSIPLFHPPVAPASFGLPEGTPLSPAAVNYMVNATVLEPRGLAALLLSLVQRDNCAVSGDASTGFRIQATDRNDSPYAEERAVRARMMAAGSVALGTDGAESIAAMLKEARALLLKGCPAAWSLNRGWTAAGIVLALMGIVVSVYLCFGLPAQWGSFVQEQLIIAIVLLVVLPGILLLVVYLIRQKSVFVTLLVVAMVGGGGFVFLTDRAVALFWWLSNPLLTGGLFAMVLAPCVFGPLMKAPSAEGRKLLDACEGLALYIKTAESERFKQYNPPERTPELFTRLLPYAVALNLEKAWGEQCAEALAASQHADPNELMRNEYQFVQGGVMAAVISGTAEACAVYEASQSSAFDDNDSGGSGSGGGGGGGGLC